MSRSWTTRAAPAALALTLWGASLWACADAGADEEPPLDGAASTSEERAATSAPEPAPAGLSGPRQLAARLSVRTHADLPEDAPSVVVHAPAGFRPERVRLVLYLHGWEGCAAQFGPTGAATCQPGGPAVEGWGLAEAHAGAGEAQSLLVVPQLAWRARSGTPGRFSEPGVADAWLRALVAELLGPELGLERLEDIEEIVLTAHSGGYTVARELLEHGSAWPVRALVIFDGLYGGTEAFAAWAAGSPERRLVSLHTDYPATRRESQRLAELARARLGAAAVARDPEDLGAALATARVVVARSPAHHGAVPGRHLEAVLAGLSRPP